VWGKDMPRAEGEGEGRSGSEIGLSRNAMETSEYDSLAVGK
jgi:hypothetical protein